MLRPQVRRMAIAGAQLRRNFSAPPSSPPPPAAEAIRKMGAWQLHAYGDEVLYSDKVRIPPVTGANEVLVKVSAASLNPIDVQMANGYGAATLNALRKFKSDQIEFPLTLGRDFVGEVIHKGMGVRNGIQLCDKVWGAIPVHMNGSLAEYVAVDANFISTCPRGVEDTIAASTVYAGLTAWSGLFLSGQLGDLSGAVTSRGGGRGKRICVLGASGGVGHLAVQMAHAEGVEVVATCSADSIEMVCELGADVIIDYRQPDAEQRLVSQGPYDIVLDCAGKGPEYASQVDWVFKHYVTFSSPWLRNNDEHGMVCGSVKSFVELAQTNVQSVLSNKGLVKWAYVAMLPNGLEYLHKLLEQGKIHPAIDSTYDFKQADSAFCRMSEGHLRGKVVLKV